MIRPGFRAAPARPSPTWSAPPSSLRLTPTAPADAQSPSAPAPRAGEPFIGPADPRWVLAIRTAESLQGAILPPERRQRLIRLGQLLGLSAFDSNLVIAIVQDQARRGYAADYCPTAGAEQLTMIRLPRAYQRKPPRRPLLRPRLRRDLLRAAVLGAVAAGEIALVIWLLG